MIKKCLLKEKLVTQEAWKNAQKEASIHSKCSHHSNVVKLYDSLETDTEYQMYMEYCDKADKLTEKIREVRLPAHALISFRSLTFSETHPYWQKRETGFLRLRHFGRTAVLP